MRMIDVFRRASWLEVAASVILFLVIGACVITVRGDWPKPGYKGIVEEVRGTSRGVLLDLDGHFPNQKMTIWVPGEVCRSVTAAHGGRWPQVGWVVRAIGSTTEYHGRPEIVINSPDQLVYDATSVAQDQ